MELVHQVGIALYKSQTYTSNLTPEVLALDGISGQKTRHFYNNLCNYTDVRYLEIGVWKGAGICSAMSGNRITGLVMDRWDDFTECKREFLRNMNRFHGQNSVRFMEKNFWEIDPKRRFNILVYAGPHIKHLLALKQWFI